MKRKVLFSAALAGLMLASCSSSNDLKGESAPFSENGQGFVNVSLNLPVQPTSTSRAANDSYDHGEADEYKVNNAMLILFAGNSESEATFQGAYNLEGWKTESQTDQISTKLSKVQKINAIPTSGKVYAFVVLNNNDALQVTTTNGLKVNSEDFTGKFEDLAKKQISVNLVKDKLMMSNAVLSSKPGSADFSSITATTLTDVTSSIAASESEATTKPAADIYVERLAAKVTVSGEDGTSTNTVSVDGNAAATFSYALTAWGLANVNSSSYLTRQYDNTWNSYLANGADFTTTTHTDYDNNKYRFAGIKKIETGKGYRTYWGTDANYDSDASFADGTTEPTLANKATTYCYENTFNVAHQNVKNTTCAIVKMKITPNSYTDGTFYTIDDNKGLIYSKNSVITEIGNKVLKDLASKIKSDDYFPSASDEVTVKSVDFDDAAGVVDIKKIVLKCGSNEKNVTDTDLATFKASIKVNEFKDGFAYYTVLIKHFGDELTPWNSATKTTASYPGDDAEKNWLGRYGVLRNNWYELSITGVAAIGASTPGELDVNNDDTPDDNLKRYISCKINVLSWAKRTQSTILQ